MENTENRPKYTVRLYNRGHETAYVSTAPTEEAAKQEALIWYRNTFMAMRVRPKMYVVAYRSEEEIVQSYLELYAASKSN